MSQGNTGCHHKVFAIFLFLLPPSLSSSLSFSGTISFLISWKMISFLSLKPWSPPQVGLSWQFLKKGGSVSKVIPTLASKRIKFSLFNFVYYSKSSQKSCKVCPFLYLLLEEMETKRDKVPPWNYPSIGS